MKKFLISLMFLTSCAPGYILKPFELAKANPGKNVCFNVTTDDKIANGYYCLLYKGPIKSKEK